MSRPFQTINIIYSTKSLNLVDFYTLEPLYKVKVDRHVPQIESRRVQAGPDSYNDEALLDDHRPWKDNVCTATFKLTSLNVCLSIHEHTDIEFKRDHILSSQYTFSSPFLNSTTLMWKADGVFSGNFLLTDDTKGTVLARFRNRLFSNTEVGTLEIVDEIAPDLKDEVVISGLAMLVMLQSLNLSVMIMV
ncbi:hypothetical protein BGW36DRAFT_427843 [Talaromyces proteolyticus]|uniref:Uncharacterized protein n=1 Tax=Talaromyces proteolyticus TaxID=1131652 RepID=A0AAD4KSR1_9EURO|nr:uncharacterized protein BGW36DRAFT_427843 [Talaromyces proteolyticus]KAH8697903.1 hypothetical protein BGW36DRAFT_427843 [Talaromyces proteolyticus]